MRTGIYRVTIASGGAIPTKVEELAAGAWSQTALSVSGSHLLPTADFSLGRVFMPATFQGVTLNFKDTYLDAGTPVDAYLDDASLAQIASIDAIASASITMPAEFATFMHLYVQLLDAGGSPQAQSQDTVIVFALKAATRPNA